MALKLIKSFVDCELMLLYLLIMMLYLLQVFGYRLILFGNKIKYSVCLKDVQTDMTHVSVEMD